MGLRQVLPVHTNSTTRSSATTSLDGASALASVRPMPKYGRSNLKQQTLTHRAPHTPLARRDDDAEPPIRTRGFPQPKTRADTGSSRAATPSASAEAPAEWLETRSKPVRHGSASASPASLAPSKRAVRPPQMRSGRETRAAQPNPAAAAIAWTGHRTRTPHRNSRRRVSRRIIGLILVLRSDSGTHQPLAVEQSG
jgi:hypothetical protein